MEDTNADTKTSADDPSQGALTYTDEENDLENRSNQSYKAFDTGSTPSSLTLNNDLFSDFKKTVFTSRPNIANLYNTIGTMPLYDYAKTHTKESRNKIVKTRKAALHSTMHEHVRKVLGSAIADSVIKQLKTNDSISTVQHYSPLGHPDSLNSVIENALPYFGASNPAFQNVVVLSCASVSFNNTKFPRGHLFHSYSDNTLHTNQVNLFGHSVDARPVIHHPPYAMDGIIESRNALTQLQRENKLTKEMSQEITRLFSTLYASPYALSQDDFVDQLTVTNFEFFKKLFAHYNKPTPNLIYLAQEKVVLDLLLEHHLHQDTTIHRMLFDPSLHTLIERYFEGVTGAFSLEKGLGTYLFWAVPKGTKYRTQLWRDGNTLKTADGAYSVELTPDAIEQAIHNKELIPSVMITFSVLALYYGLILGGGYEQTYYLSQTKKNYTAMLTEFGDSESVEATEGLITTNLVIPRPLLLYLEGESDLRVPATGLDMYLYGDKGKSWGNILEAAKKVTMAEIIERTLPSIYREYCKDAANFSTFSQLAERDIEKFNGLDAKIPSLSKI